MQVVPDAETRQFEGLILSSLGFRSNDYLTKWNWGRGMKDSNDSINFRCQYGWKFYFE